MTENELSTIVVDICYKMHVKIGPGLLESVYESILYYELTKKGLFVERQKPVPVVWDEIKLDIGFRTDLIIENKIIVELKSIESLAPVHYKQVLTYLRLSGIKLGFVINFNEELLRNGIKRIINGSL